MSNDKTRPFNDIHFLKMTLDLFKINWHISAHELSRIPAEGPTIIVANHRFGALEGMLMAYILLQLRSDVKIMANNFLQRIPEISDIFIGVHPFEGTSAAGFFRAQQISEEFRTAYAVMERYRSTQRPKPPLSLPVWPGVH